IPLELASPLAYSVVEELSRIREDSIACAQRITALARTCLVSLVVRLTKVTPRALLEPGSISTWLTMASVIRVQFPVASASFTVVNGLLKYEKVLQPRSHGPQAWQAARPL